MNVGAVVLARLDSSRLRKKALRDVGGQPLVQHAFDVCAATEGVASTVLATTDRAIDDELVEYAEAVGVPVYRGSTNNVATRFSCAMDHFGFDAAIRYNGDSPLNRPALLSKAVALFRDGLWEFVSNVPNRTFPYGISVEVVEARLMREACFRMTDPSHQEHVTKYFYDNPSFAKCCYITAEAKNMSGVHLAVDDDKDLKRATWILNSLREDRLTASLDDIIYLAVEFSKIPSVSVE